MTYKIIRLSVSSTAKASDALNLETEKGMKPIHFFRTNQGDLGVVLEGENSKLGNIVKKAKAEKKANAEPVETPEENLADEVDDLLD